MERPIEASVTLAEPLRHVRAALGAQPGIVVAASAPDWRESGPYDGALAIEIGDGTRVVQTLTCDLGPSARDGDTVVLPVQWQPTSHAHVLPAFAGQFELTAAPPGTRLVLRGTYTIPLGPAGRVGDRVAGRRLAQRVLDGHLEAVAERIDQAAQEAAAAALKAPDPDDGPGPENYLG